MPWEKNDNRKSKYVTVLRGKMVSCQTKSWTKTEDTIDQKNTSLQISPRSFADPGLESATRRDTINQTNLAETLGGVVVCSPDLSWCPPRTASVTVGLDSVAVRCYLQFKLSGCVFAIRGAIRKEVCKREPAIPKVKHILLKHAPLKQLCMKTWRSHNTHCKCMRAAPKF